MMGNQHVRANMDSPHALWESKTKTTIETRHDKNMVHLSPTSLLFESHWGSNNRI